MKRLALALALTACGDAPAGPAARAPASEPAQVPASEPANNEKSEAKSVSAIKRFRGDPLNLERFTALVGGSEFAGTRALDVNESPVGDAGLVALAGSPHAQSLRVLWFDQTGAGDAGAQALGRSALALEELYIGYNRVGPAGLQALLDASAARWKILRLSFNPLTDAGADALARSPRLGDLERLELVATGLGEPGLRAVLGSTTLSRLDTLDIGHNTRAPRALEALLDPTHLPALRTLYAEGLCCEAALLQQVRAARPQVDIQATCP